ncbi:AP2-like ethylene-responsive transcription factor AIL7 [Brassica rapa]|uniref:AP2-like ethylene-responsive transcription factor AIL7 n=1 Tax=Brassica campestris TaxID=3711 RepID=UPI000872E9EE|nr:AP2-like ethylene-responsive transcription factor AIL7 [Brassica rapa]
MANWLTFALSPMEMMKSPEHPHFVSYDDDSSAPYLIDNLYVLKEEAETSMADSTALASFFNPQTHSPTHIPKLEDFLGDSSSSSFVRFPDNQPETLDSSSLYHPRHHTGVTGLFSDHQHDDFQAVEGGVKEGCTKEGALSLAVNNTDGERVKSSRKVTVSKKEAKAVETTSTDDSTKKKKKVVESFGQRTSIYRGVTRHRWTGRYEAHLWDNSCRREGQARKGRQVYLGGYDKEDKAARAYDLAALKYWGPAATTNFQIASYSKELEEMNHMTKQEFIASIRRKSSGFSRGASMYRGVTRHHQQGRWQARIGRVAGNKDLYLGTFATEEEAAEAYDIAAIKFRGINAVTNFEMNRYDVEAIMNSSFPVGGSAVKRHKQLSLESPPPPTDDHNIQQLLLPSSSVELDPNSIPCGIPFDPSVLYHPQNFFQHYPDPTVPMNQADQFFMWSNQSY